MSFSFVKKLKLQNCSFFFFESKAQATQRNFRTGKHIFDTKEKKEISKYRKSIGFGALYRVYFLHGLNKIKRGTYNVHSNTIKYISEFNKIDYKTQYTCKISLCSGTLNV